MFTCINTVMSFCTCLPIFIQIGPHAAELWHHSHFQDGGPSIVILLSVSSLVTCLLYESRNLPAVSQSTAKILLLKTNGRHIGILLLVLSITFVSSSAWLSASATNFVHIGPSSAKSWHHICFLISWPLHHSSTSGFVFVDFQGRSLTSDQISARYLHPWLRYYYFWFLKTNTCWNSTPGFDCHICVILGMSFCIWTSNFVRTGPSATAMTSYLLIKMVTMAS